MKTLLDFAATFATLYINGLNVGLCWELGIHHNLKVGSLPYIACLWVAILFYNLAPITGEKQTETERIALSVANMVRSALVFVVIGAIYLAAGGYKP